MSNDDRETEARRFFLQQFVGFEAEVEPQVQEIYAKAMILCAKGDGVLHPHERKWIRGYFSNTGASRATIDLVDTWEGNADEIMDLLGGDERTAASAARNLVFDALRVCEADGELADGERKSIYGMAAKMGLSEAATQQVEAAYEVYRAALNNKMRVLFPDGPPFQE
ncbi:MAG: hypothetical protein AB8I08_36715 [Sandaracinaceae bacterium]